MKKETPAGPTMGLINLKMGLYAKEAINAFTKANMTIKVDGIPSEIDSLCKREGARNYGFLED